jgi:exonuclease SbcC
MRPLRLELSGFTSYREETVVDFEGADYFALVGQTGSGKSTIIDAICFALYGSVPRYDNRNLVAPVVTQGQLEARVKLDFEVDGAAYSATRVVRRSGKGATTKEARLEKGDEVLAGTADELSAKVADLIGLSFEHFTRCVVLPQGEFSRFLHDKPADRQDMLVRLLGLEVFDRMRVRASGLAAEIATRLGVITERLSDEFDHATAENLKAAGAYVKRLENLRKQLGDALPKLQKLQSEMTEARAAAETALATARRLLGLEVPADVMGSAERIRGASADLEAASVALEAAQEAASAALTAVSSAPDKAPLQVALKAHSELADLTRRAADLDAALAVAADRETSARAAAAEALSATEAAQAAIEAARDRHAAQHLASSLQVGEPCPVCLTVVESLPHHDKATAIEDAERAVVSARSSLEAATKAAKAKSDDRAKLEASAAALHDRIGELTQQLEGRPDPSRIEATLAEISALEETLSTARSAESETRERMQQAKALVSELKEAEAAARLRFENLRDTLTPLGAPAPSRDSLLADWEQLLGWARELVPELSARAAEESNRADELQDELTMGLKELAEACAECELDINAGVTPEAMRDLVVHSLADAKHDAKEIAADIETAAKLRAELKGSTLDHERAASLARHLNATGFERWLVNEALHRLVHGATQILKELSNGQYSLSVDSTNTFVVTDHNNANETRPAKTLSGGETFLASLSLALALSDQLIELAAEGSAKLDAIFLDEGFGTLDAETLDTVAATVENLAAGGRMVGIVTHVRELADRIPLQFRVTKDSRTSAVERVAV